jgi:hypothetical protein
VKDKSAPRLIRVVRDWLSGTNPAVCSVNLCSGVIVAGAGSENPPITKRPNGISARLPSAKQDRRIIFDLQAPFQINQ